MKPHECEGSGNSAAITHTKMTYGTSIVTGDCEFFYVCKIFIRINLFMIMREINEYSECMFVYLFRFNRCITTMV